MVAALDEVEAGAVAEPRQRGAEQGELAERVAGFMKRLCHGCAASRRLGPSRMATRLTGWAAIELAERLGARLSKRADDEGPARDDLTIEEARALAARRPERVYIDVDEIPPGAGGTAVG